MVKCNEKKEKPMDTRRLISKPSSRSIVAIALVLIYLADIQPTIYIREPQITLENRTNGRIMVKT